MLKKYGFKVTNLGMNVKAEMVLEACHILHPNYTIIMANNGFENDGLEPYLLNLCKNIGECTVLLTGFQAIKQNIQSTRKIKVLSSLEKILEFCNNLKDKKTKTN